MAREIPDRREALPNLRARLWFDVGGGKLRCVTVPRHNVNPEAIERIANALDAEILPSPRRVYGDHGNAA